MLLDIAPVSCDVFCKGLSGCTIQKKPNVGQKPTSRGRTRDQLQVPVILTENDWLTRRQLPEDRSGNSRSACIRPFIGTLRNTCQVLYPGRCSKQREPQLNRGMPSFLDTLALQIENFRKKIGALMVPRRTQHRSSKLVQLEREQEGNI